MQRRKRLTPTGSQEEHLSSSLGRAWTLGALRAGLHSDTLSPTRPNLLLVALPMGQHIQTTTVHQKKMAERHRERYCMVSSCSRVLQPSPPHTHKPMHMCTQEQIYLIIYLLCFNFFSLRIWYIHKMCLSKSIPIPSLQVPPLSSS